MHTHTLPGEGGAGRKGRAREKRKGRRGKEGSNEDRGYRSRKTNCKVPHGETNQALSFENKLETGCRER